MRLLSALLVLAGATLTSSLAGSTGSSTLDYRSGTLLTNTGAVSNPTPDMLLSGKARDGFEKGGPDAAMGQTADARLGTMGFTFESYPGSAETICIWTRLNSTHLIPVAVALIPSGINFLPHP